LLQIYTGDGKGKTTAVFGLAMRAAGHGYKVMIIQFMKGSTYSGELLSAAKLGIEVYQFGKTCPYAALIKGGFMNCQKCGECSIGGKEVTDLDLEIFDMAWIFTQDTVNKGQYHLVILDEILNAVRKNLITLDVLLSWLQGVSKDNEIVLTGRTAPLELIEMADLVSEVKKIKHPYPEVKARRGIEY